MDPAPHLSLMFFHVGWVFYVGKGGEGAGYPFFLAIDRCTVQQATSEP